MKSIKDKLKSFKIKEGEESKIKNWQEYALKVIDDFGITNDKKMTLDRNGKKKIHTTNYKAVIFRHASNNNLEYLKGKVENAKEKFGSENLKNKGRYLIATFRKKKPWE